MTQYPVRDPHLPPQVAVNNGPGTAALVLGIVGLVLCWVPGLNLVLGVLATTFGGVGYSKALEGQATNARSANAGLAMGIITIVIALGLWLLLAVVDSTSTYSS